MLRQAIEEREGIIKRQARILEKMRADRGLLYSELLELQAKCERNERIIDNYRKQLNNATDTIRKMKGNEGAIKQRTNDESKVYRQSIDNLIRRNEKQETILKSLAEENKSLRKSQKSSNYKLPMIKASESRLTAPRMSIA